MAGRLASLGAVGGFATPQQRKPGFVSAAQVFQERAGGQAILFDHLSGEFDFHLRMTGGGEGFERAAVLDQREMQAVEVLKMPSDAGAGVADGIGGGLVGHGAEVSGRWGEGRVSAPGAPC